MLGTSQVALVVRNLPANAEDVRDLRDKDLIPGSGRSPGGRAGQPQSSILAWRI